MVSRIQVSHRQHVELIDFIRKVCKRDGVVAVYDPGWSDERVAAEVGFPVSLTTVRTTREDCVGKLAQPPRPPTMADMHERLVALEAWALEGGKYKAPSPGALFENGRARKGH
jgi:hypothetical protein